MEFNESDLRKIISRVLEEIDGTSKPMLYVILTDPLPFPLGLFESLYIQHEYEVVILYDEDLSIEKIRAVFPEHHHFTYIVQSCLTEFPVVDFECLFPIFNKTLIAKTVLGISDTFATKWIEHCFEKGHKISILKSGMQMLTGNEPIAYKRTFQNYVKTLVEYEVKIIDNLSDLWVQQQIGRKIITYHDVNKYQESEITLDRQDIMTDLAKEKAQELGIKIKLR